MIGVYDGDGDEDDGDFERLPTRWTEGAGESSSFAMVVEEARGMHFVISTVR